MIEPYQVHCWSLRLSNYFIFLSLILIFTSFLLKSIKNNARTEHFSCISIFTIKRNVFYWQLRHSRPTDRHRTETVTEKKISDSEKEWTNKESKSEIGGYRFVYYVQEFAVVVYLFLLKNGMFRNFREVSVVTWHHWTIEIPLKFHKWNRGARNPITICHSPIAINQLRLWGNLLKGRKK